ncbi:MAG: DJ-1/PfpI family protein [Blastochloris sp.]|nr:DJ-1/PfpI family protein [Blastochloris sp.]
MRRQAGHHTPHAFHALPCPNEAVQQTLCGRCGDTNPCLACHLEDCMQIAILAYDRMTALDAVGPYEVLCRLPNAMVHFVAAEPGPIRTDTHGFHSRFALIADARLEDVPAPDLIVVPGGSTGTLEVMRHERTLNWLRSAHATSQWTTSICTGAFILGAAGLLQGLQATTHWASKDALSQVGATYVAERFVQQGKIITAAGVVGGHRYGALPR